MARWRTFLVMCISYFALHSLFAHAQDKSKEPSKNPPIAPAEKLAEGWERIDDRLIFLMVRLASTEASLDAIENAVASSTRTQARKTGQVKQADKKNDDMDLKGGGPMKWSLFYGRTAESFFYHPTDRNSTYHTTTILGQQPPTNDNQAASGVPSRQGLPVHQRPPQFDYIYRANESAKAGAEKDIAALKGKMDLLLERRQRLEAEQAGLWCEIAFRSVSHYDLDKKPLYRFEPLLNSNATTDTRLQFETLRGAASFMALALSVVDAAQKDQPGTFSKIKPAVTKARQDLNDAWLRMGVDVTDRKSFEGKFHALAKRLEESASNLSDSYVVAMEGDRAKDQQRKDTFRGLLQESLIRYAEIILALDEMATLMKDDWRIKPDIDKPIQFVSLGSLTIQTPVLSAVKERGVISDDPVVGSWLESRANTPVSDRVRTFQTDGTFSIELPKVGKTHTGTWRRSGNKIYFSHSEDDGMPPVKDKWFEIVKLDGRSMAIAMEGQRPYEWSRISPFHRNSVWSDGGLKMKVIDQEGGTFRAKLETSEWARNITGTVEDNQVSWLAKDVKPITGGVGGDNYGTISIDANGYRMDVDWKQPNGKTGTFTLRLNK